MGIELLNYSNRLGFWEDMWDLIIKTLGNFWEFANQLSWAVDSGGYIYQLDGVIIRWAL